MNRIRFDQYLSGRAAVSIAFAGTIFAAAATIPMSELPSIGGGSIGVGRAINDRGDIVGQSYTLSFENHSTLWAAGGAPARDLGTLGGTESWAAAISPAGVIVGGSGTPDIANHAALWASASSAPIDLGTLGGANSQADGVNANGDVVGYSWLPGDNVTLHAVLWTAANRSAGIDLGTLPGGSNSWARGINASGDVVGTSDDNQWVTHPVIWPAAGRVPVALQALGGPTSSGEALGINDKGDVVGVSRNAAGANRPTLWPAAGRAPVDLGTVGGTYGAASAINALGDIVGWSNTAGDIVGHATLWRSVAATSGSGSGCKASGRSRKDRDDKSRRDRDERSRRDRDGRRSGSAVVLAPASAPASGGALTPIDLGTLPGGSFSQATGINASGLIVGFGMNASNENRAMTWAAGTVTAPPAGGGTPSTGHNGHQNGNHENEGDEDGDC